MSSSNEYMRQYMKDRYHRRKLEAVQRLGGKCVSCGSGDVQFDHMMREGKAFTIGKTLAGVAEKRLEEELKKCQLLCQKCHSEKTLNDLGQRDAREVHGTLSSYRYCRCSLCRTAKREYMREYRKTYQKP